MTATVVDCATPHQAEVYLLAPLAVNTAIDQVAEREMRSGIFVAYTGQPVQRQPFHGDVPDRFESGPDRRTIPPQHRHLLPAGRERRTTEGVRAPLIRIWS